MRYADYLRSPEWRSKRQWALERAGYRCQVCNAPGLLDVHHRTYQNLGRELPADLIVLCHEHHLLYHRAGELAASIEDEYDRTLREMTRRNRESPAA